MTSRIPTSASAATSTVRVKVVGVTVTAPRVSPVAGLKVTVAPSRKFFPWMVKERDIPRPMIEGLRYSMAGAEVTVRAGSWVMTC